MKGNKIMKKLICVFASVFVFVNVFALDPFQIDLNLGFGSSFGEIKEYVIYTPTNSDEYTLSRLDWDLDFIKYAEASVDVCLFEHVFISVGGRLGIPSRSGDMQDYDWMNSYDYLDYIKENPKKNWITNYSIHKNRLSKYIDGNVTLGGIIKLPVKIFIMPNVSLQYQDFGFDGIDGYLQYAAEGADCISEWNDTIPKIGVSGKVISYNQKRLFLFAGLQVYTTIVPNFCFLLEGKYSPLVKIDAIDTHWGRRLAFLDQPMGGGAWAVSGEVDYALTRLFKLSLDVEYQYLPKLKGKNYYKTLGEEGWKPSSDVLGGASSQIFSISFMATLFF